MLKKEVTMTGCDVETQGSALSAVSEYLRGINRLQNLGSASALCRQSHGNSD